MAHCRTDKYVNPCQVCALMAISLSATSMLREWVNNPEERVLLKPTDNGVVLMALLETETCALTTRPTFMTLMEGFEKHSDRCPVRFVDDPGYHIEFMLNELNRDSYGFLSNRGEVLVPIQIALVKAAHHNWPKLARAIDKIFAKYTGRRINRWWQRVWREIQEMRVS